MNAAIATQGSVANAITTAIVLSDRFIIWCTAGTSVVFGIRVLSGSAAESLGFVQNQTAGAFGPVDEEEGGGGGGGDLDLVATNTVATTTAISSVSSVTSQVTGDYPVATVGTLNIENADLTHVTFADAFSNGISHALNSSSIFKM